MNLSHYSWTMAGSSSAVGQDLGYVSGVCSVSAREYESDSLTVQPLETAWWLPFQDYSPARAFPSFKGQRNFTGLLWCATRLVGYESWLERDHLLALDFDPAGPARPLTPARSVSGPDQRWSHRRLVPARSLLPPAALDGHRLAPMISWVRRDSSVHPSMITLRRHAVTLSSTRCHHRAGF